MVVHKHRRRRDLRKRHIGYDCYTERSNDSTRPERGEAVARWVGLMASDFRFGQKLTNEARLGMSALVPPGTPVRGRGRLFRNQHRHPWTHFGLRSNKRVPRRLVA
jgi:hypothetical protein